MEWSASLRGLWVDPQHGPSLGQSRRQPQPTGGALAKRGGAPIPHPFPSLSYRLPLPSQFPSSPPLLPSLLLSHPVVLPLPSLPLEVGPPEI